MRMLLALFLVFLPGIAGAEERELVVLLHGLARTSASMEKMAEALRAAGYEVCNIDYPSREFAIEELAAQKVLPEILKCRGQAERPVSFVTHSMGGIVVRALAKTPLRIGRVVMLGPPNGGSEIVDRLGGLALFGWVNGPAGRQLGTGADQLPHRLGAAKFDVGVIAGKRTVNPVLSLLIPGQDDGKVSLASAKVEGMDDFLVVPVSHSFLMRDKVVIAQTLHFLQDGRFEHAGEHIAAEAGPMPQSAPAGQGN